MQKTLANKDDRAEISCRIRTLGPGSTRLWGSMSVDGMVCHLDDAFALALGQRPAERVRLPLPGAWIKYLALQVPVRWAQNIRTVEEVRQGGGGTLPADFAADRGRLLRTLECFCSAQQLAGVKHPMFGVMSHSDWMRWGYLHTDHHLRQFSA